MSKLNIFSHIPTVLTLLIMPVTSAIALLAVAKPIIAQSDNLNNFDLALGVHQPNATVMGYTGGAYSLASIVNKDRYGNHCMGYGDPKPDHIMILKNDFERLRIQVKSGSKDTTLVIRKVEENDIRCGFAQHINQDAVIDSQNWQAGKYEIWVGSMKPNQRSNYRLSVQ